MLPADERATVLGSMVGLAYNYLEPGTAEALLEALRMTNAFEQLLEETISQGLEQGLQQGRERGLEQGLAAAKREDVLKVLSRRFGPPGPEFISRIEVIADPARLSTLFDAALDADTLAEFEHALDGAPDA